MLPVKGLTGRGMMPKETLNPTVKSIDPSAALTVQWGPNNVGEVLVNGISLNERMVNRLLTVLKKAKRQTFPIDPRWLE